MDLQYYNEAEADRDVIVVNQVPTIWVYNLAYVDFIVPPGSTVFFGDDHGDPLAFVLIIELQDILARMAIEWYAGEALDYPYMKITNTDSRPAGHK